MIKLTAQHTEFELSPTLAANELVAEKRANGEEIIHLGFGESPFPVPDRLIAALQQQAHLKQYLPTTGLPQLRVAVAEYYRERTDIDIEQFDVIIAPGSKLILYALQMAVAGDLLLPVPSWVSYEPQAKMLGTEVIKIATRLDSDGYHLDPSVLEETIIQARSQGRNPGKLILNYPSNPTGLTISESELEAIANVCRKHNIFIISDEIYGFVNHGTQYQTIAKCASDITAVSSGLSKHLSLGGWRIGIGLIPKSVNGLFSQLGNIASELWSCVPAPIQQASVVAYEGHKDVEEFISSCDELHGLMNRYISAGLQNLGVIAPTPQGAFYNYPDFEPFRTQLQAAGIKTSQDLASTLLRDYNLSSLPGVAFGEDPERLTLRLAGCDYDGAAVLQAYANAKQAGSLSLDDAFVAKYAPRIKLAVTTFERFLADIQSEQ